MKKAALLVGGVSLLVMPLFAYADVCVSHTGDYSNFANDNVSFGASGMVYQKFHTTSACNVSSVSAEFDSPSTAYVSIWSDNGGSWGSSLVSHSVPSDGGWPNWSWRTASMTYSLAANTDYWLGFTNDSGWGDIGYSRGDASGDMWRGGSPFYPSYGINAWFQIDGTVPSSGGGSSGSSTVIDIATSSERLHVDFSAIALFAEAMAISSLVYLFLRVVGAVIGRDSGRS